MGKFARFLQYVARDSCSLGELEHFLDDFLFEGKAGGTDECKQIISAFNATCSKMEVRIAEGKTEGPQTVIIILGLELDSVLMEVRIPKEKKNEHLQTQIIEILKNEEHQAECHAISPWLFAFHVPSHCIWVSILPLAD